MSYRKAGRNYYKTHLHSFERGLSDESRDERAIWSKATRESLHHRFNSCQIAAPHQPS